MPKALMREAVEYSSAVCFLIGTETWQSRWVKYEVARAVVDQRGLLAVHLNGLNHVHRKASDPLGYNPLHCMGLYHSPSGSYFLCEKMVKVDARTGRLDWAWRAYDDFKGPVSMPRYIPAVQRGYVMPLARYTREYEYLSEAGHQNLGAWIDMAAAEVGR